MSLENVSMILPRIREVSTLPQVATRAMSVVENPNSSAADLRDVIRNDPALTAALMKTVNSAYYGLQREVSNLHTAVAFLGFKTVRNLIVHASVAEMFKDPTPIGPYCRRALWEHMVAVGVCSGLIARRVGGVEPEDAFLAGILHDLGIVLEDQYIHDGFVRVVDGVVAGGGSWMAVEQSTLGFDHAELGGALAEHWRFPQVARAAIANHADPEKSPPAMRGLVNTTIVADFLVETRGYLAVGVPEGAEPDESILRQLRLGRDDLKILYDDLKAELEEARQLFESGVN